jgi:hypothetical protein
MKDKLKKTNRRFFSLVLAISFLFSLNGFANDDSVTQGGTSNRVWLDSEGKALPFKSGEEIEEFLLTANVVSGEKILSGITQPLKVLLEKDGVRSYAVFRYVDLFQDEWRGERGMVRKNFRDSCYFEIAAYKLSKMLGLDCVPPVVLRKVQGQEGSLQIWVEYTITEKMRQDHKIDPPNQSSWRMQHEAMALFDNLIFNDDRNDGNVLIDPTWRLRWIDHTRAFRAFSQLSNFDEIHQIEEGMWKRLCDLDEEEVKERLHDCLRSTEISTLLKRRDLLVTKIQNLIDERGEEEVLFRFY